VARADGASSSPHLNAVDFPHFPWLLSEQLLHLLHSSWHAAPLLLQLLLLLLHKLAHPTLPSAPLSGM